MKKVQFLNRRFAAVVPAVVLALALAGCGSNAADSDSSVGSPVGSGLETTVAAAAASPVTEPNTEAPVPDAAAEATVSDAATAAATDDSVAGNWTVSTGQGGYRVSEVLQGQKTEAVGRTTAVTGSMTIAGTQATAASFEFDLTKLESGSDKRDGQVQGRILQTAQFPTAAFTLTAPADFGSVPAEGEQIAVKATGDLTLHGVTKSVTVDIQARRQGAEIQVLGSLPITFADYGIENPSVKPLVEVGETGTIEWLVSLAKA